jgi:hypothetical protein
MPHLTELLYQAGFDRVMVFGNGRMEPPRDAEHGGISPPCAGGSGRGIPGRERHIMIQGIGCCVLSLCGGQARVLFLETTSMVQTAADIHQATPVCVAALAG